MSEPSTQSGTEDELETDKYGELSKHMQYAAMLTNKRWTSIISDRFANIERHGCTDERSENRNRDFD